MSILSGIGREAGSEGLGKVADAAKEVGQAGERIANGLESALRDAQEKASVDVALLVNATLLELQAWRRELAAFRQMLEPLTRGVTITVTPNQN